MTGMARVVALVPDLLFGSRVQSDLSAAGYEVEMVGTVERALVRLTGADVLLVDLTDERLESFVELVRRLGTPDTEATGDQPSTRPRTLGFYSHVDTTTQEKAQQAGFDMVVPRSRMAREGAQVVARLVEGR